MKLAEKIAWFRRGFVAILPVERAACDTFEASTQTGTRGGSGTGHDVERAQVVDSAIGSKLQNP